MFSTQESIHHIQRDISTREWRMTAADIVQLPTISTTSLKTTSSNAMTTHHNPTQPQPDLNANTVDLTSEKPNLHNPVHPDPVVQPNLKSLTTRTTRQHDSNHRNYQVKSVGFPSTIVKHTHAYSRRLRELAHGKGRRVMRLHKRMNHAPEYVMCAACKGPQPLWTNTYLDEKNIRRFFRKEPCLICVLAKKRK